jgi:tRNA pseudouridine32 synthase/23S rRNA pseudouridine746 synthase
VLPPVLHHDEHLIALDKPSGLLSVPGIGPEKADCLAARVAAEHPTAVIVHRLDRDTSGVIVLALDAPTQRALGRQFERREVRKRYIAIVDGVVGSDEGEVDLPMRVDLDNRPHQIIDFVHGKSALTRFRVLDRDDDRTRVELRPVTGRSHQLRVHMREIGHPILGDDLYAPPEARNRTARLMLHAESLTITHPATGERLRIESPCPFP